MFGNQTKIERRKGNPEAFKEDFLVLYPRLKGYCRLFIAGGVWTAPYRLDSTNLVQQGENEIKIEVVNTWVNRLIGDSKLPAEQRPTWCPVIPYTPESPLQPSGLFGPVQILSVRY